MALCLPLLFLPKINLLPIAGETAGIRIDDLILAIAAILMLWIRCNVPTALTAIESTLVAIVMFSIASFALNQLFVAHGWLHVNGSIYYCLRLFEYFLFFYIGAIASRYLSIEKITMLFFSWNLLLMALQKIGLLGIFTSSGYQPYSGDRMLGVASFGAEMGLLLDMLFCCMITAAPTPLFSQLSSMQQWKNRLYPPFLLLLCLFLAILTGARTAIITLPICFLLNFKLLDRNPKIQPLLAMATLFVAAAVTAYGLHHFSSILNRSQGLFSSSNFHLISTVWSNIPTEHDPIGREIISNLGYDTSWWMRLHKWCYALKIYVQHPESWLQGIGPGFAMAALDGGYVRIIAELGILGSMLYARLFFLLAALSPQMLLVMTAFLINMLFFDAYLAYKPMCLLFLLAGGHGYGQRA
jgi:hypothetical protein